MNKFTKYFYITSVYLFLYLPIVIVVIFSFNNAKHSLSWQGFSLKWYTALFQDIGLIKVALNSFVLALLAASTATIIGALISITLFRYRFFGKKILHGLIFILVLTPEIIMAIALLLFYNFLNIPLGFWTLFIAHTAMCVPFVAVTVYSRIAALDKDIFEAAVDLGANDLIILTKIITPLLSHAIVFGWLLSFILSLDDVIISYFVSGPTFNVLPLKIYSMVRLGVKPEVNALCSLLLIFTLIIAIIGHYSIFKKKPK